MARYFSAHTTACLTKQALKDLMQRLLASTDVKVLRVVSSQVGGRMLTEAEAPDRQILEKFFDVNYVNCEWIMPIDLDAQPEGITEY
jgi:hypothetical protein